MFHNSYVLSTLHYIFPSKNQVPCNFIYHANAARIMAGKPGIIIICFPFINCLMLFDYLGMESEQLKALLKMDGMQWLVIT